MIKRFLLLMLMCLLMTGCGAASAETFEALLSMPNVELTPADRVLVLAPHPDDETLGAGGVIQQAVALDVPVHIVWLTYGDYNEWSFILYRKRPNLTPSEVRQMGALRRQEAITAATLLGVPTHNLIFLGYPDFGTLNIWYAHWGEDRPPLRSRLARATSVPYATAFRPGADYKGEEIVEDLKAVLRQVRPTKILVSHSADHHPDHRALYLYLQVALWDLADEVKAEVYPYLIHYPGWPQPAGYDPDAALHPPADLLEAFWQTLSLAPEQVERKLEALKAHGTQYTSGGRKLRAFVRQNELFGDFPTLTLFEGRVVEQDEDAGAVEIPEQLTDAEEDLFVEVEEQAVRLEEDEVVLAIRLSRRLRQEVQMLVYAFGYHPDVPFAEMPKLRVVFGLLRHSVYDQNRRLPNDSVVVTRQPRRIEIRIPLALLNQPERLLVSARTVLGEVPLDWLAWRAFILPQAE